MHQMFSVCSSPVIQLFVSARTTILAMMAALFLATPAIGDQAAVEKAISDQIAAFTADDFGAAFGFASPSIKRLFGTPERFGQMVQQGYPMVYRAQQVQMLSQRQTRDGLVQQVIIRDAQGRLHVLDYQMVMVERGWLINGVQLLNAGEAGV